MTAMSSLPVFCASGPLEAEGQTMVLDGAEGRHAARVRRIRPGQAVQLCDGTGEVADCLVLDTRRDELELRVQHRRYQPPPPLRVTVAQALVKGERSELAVELATEAGVDAILPWQAERCVARWDDAARAAKGRARWGSAAERAAKQARRPVVPAIGAAVRTPELSQRCRQATAALVLHGAAELALPAVPLPETGEVLLVVGPEGGITDGELAELTAAGASAVRLGPEVLRASTAGAVALGVLGALTARWR